MLKNVRKSLCPSWNDSMKITQPVLLQSFKDEFALPNYTFDTPAIQGQVLQAV